MSWNLIFDEIFFGLIFSSRMWIFQLKLTSFLKWCGWNDFDNFEKQIVFNLIGYIKIKHFILIEQFVAEIGIYQSQFVAFNGLSEIKMIALTIFNQKIHLNYQITQRSTIFLIKLSHFPSNSTEFHFYFVHEHNLHTIWTDKNSLCYITHTKIQTKKISIKTFEQKLHWTNYPIKLSLHRPFMSSSISK